MTFTSGYISAPAGTLYFFPKASPMLGFSFNFSFDARERYSMLDGDGMLDGHETVEIACGELRYRACWTQMGRGRTRDRGNSLRRASLACWTEMGRGRTRNRGNSLRRASLACWTEMGRGRTQNRGNSLRRASLACWTEMGRGRTRNRGNSIA